MIWMIPEGAIYIYILYRILRKKSMVIVGTTAAGKTALLYQLGAENGFDKEYKQTEPNPPIIEFDFNGVSIFAQDTGGEYTQRIKGGLDEHVKKSNYIVIVIDGNKFISEIENNPNSKYIEDNEQILSYCYKFVDEYNKKRFFKRKKIIVVLSHLDEYNGSDTNMRNQIYKWAVEGKYGFENLFRYERCCCLNLSDPNNKASIQKEFLKLIKNDE